MLRPRVIYIFEYKWDTELAAIYVASGGTLPGKVSQYIIAAYRPFRPCFIGHSV